MTRYQPHAPLIPTHGNDVEGWPRYVNAAAGAWLVLSSVFWTHLPLQRTNSWVTGVLIFAAAVLAMGFPRWRFANAVLAAWLFVSSVFLHAYHFTRVNNAIVAVVVFVFSWVTLAKPPKSPST